MEWLFSWGVSSWIVGLCVAVAFGFIALDDFKLSKILFLIAAADASGGIVMWGVQSQRPLWQVVLLVSISMAIVGTLTVLSLRYVDKKREGKHTAANFQKLVCQVMSVDIEKDLARFFQSPPVYYQPLDTMIRVSLTNQTRKPLFFRDHSVSALVGNRWIQFTNAQSGAYEPYAFGAFVSRDGKRFIGRFDLSSNGFDYVMQQKPLGPEEALELWMFFISGLSAKDRPAISQFKFIFHDSANEELECISKYSFKDDRGTVVGFKEGNLRALDLEPIPPDLREEPHIR